MTVNRSTIVTLLLIWSGSICAQRVDTVYKDDPNFPYHLVEMDAEGKPHGVARIYDNNGVVRRTYHNLNGIWHGPDTIFDDEARVRRVALVENGQIIGTTLIYSAEGKLEATREYEKGKVHGMVTFYHPNGRVSMSAPYKRGRLHGIVNTYHPNGNIEWKMGYRKDKLHGERIALDSTGVPMEGPHTFMVAPYNTISYTVGCHSGKPVGKFKMVNADGRVFYTGQFVNGLPDGEWIYYERTGLVDRVDVYRKGKFKETRRTYN